MYNKMRECGKCKIEKDNGEFYKNRNNLKTGLSSYCKDCQKANKKIHYANNKENYITNGLKNKKWFMDYKRGLECNRCGFSHPAALDFHHKDPSTKEIRFDRVSKNNQEKIMKEIEKCEVLCSNCHRIHHSKHY